MTRFKLHVFLFLLLGGLHCIMGSPHPLVSSSGMMPLHPSKRPPNLDTQPDQTSTELSFSDNIEGEADALSPSNDDKSDPISPSNDSEADAVSSSNSGEEKHVVKKSISPNAYFSPSDFFNNPDPETWQIKKKKDTTTGNAANPNKNQVAWRTDKGNKNSNTNFSSEPPKPQLIGEQRQILLHPFIGGRTKMLKMATNIITPSTTPMSELTRLIMETVTLPQMEELRYKDETGGSQPTVVMAPIDSDKNVTENTVIPNKAEVLFLDSTNDAFFKDQPVEHLKRLIRKTVKETTVKPTVKITTTTTTTTTTKHTTTKPTTMKPLPSTTKPPHTTLKPTLKPTKPSTTKPTHKTTTPPIMVTTPKHTKHTTTQRPVITTGGTMQQNETHPGIETTTVAPIDMEGEPKPAKNSSLKPNILGPPWKNEYIVGKLVVGAEEILLDPVEVSFKVASRLCHKIGKQNGPNSLKPKRYFLWAPINQYVPLLRKAFPIRPPIFAPECLKFVLMHCRGVIKLPLLKPCTYWAPMPIKRPECGFNPNAQSHIVNYRLPEYVPGNCPCTWPCIERFDPIQRCRVTLNESERTMDPIHSDGEPMNGREIVMQDYLAAQLCRGMKLALTVDTPVPIGWVPIRVDVDTETSHLGHTHSAEEAVTLPARKRRSAEETEEDRVKREQIFIDPDKDNSTTSEEDSDEDKDDRFALMNTYNLERKYGQDGNDTNGTTIVKCKVWSYKPCPREDGGSEEIMDEYAAQKLKRKKRSIPSYLSRFALGLDMKDDDVTFWANRRFTRQTQLDADDILEEDMDCGEWVETDSYKCVPEEHLHKITNPEDSSSSSEEEGESKKPDKSKDTTPHKKVVKDLCPGSSDKFPCFLRRKRSVSVDNVEKEEKKETKRETIANAALVSSTANTDSNAPFLINKILIQPDPGCMCDWPCLPFFDKYNKCYDERGNVLVDKMGRNKVEFRSFRKDQRDPVTCINFVETDEIFCKIKD